MTPSVALSTRVWSWLFLLLCTFDVVLQLLFFRLPLQAIFDYFHECFFFFFRYGPNFHTIGLFVWVEIKLKFFNALDHFSYHLSWDFKRGLIDFMILLVRRVTFPLPQLLFSPRHLLNCIPCFLASIGRDRQDWPLAQFQPVSVHDWLSYMKHDWLSYMFVWY